ncbi:MAG: hypothetical protein P8104_09820 [Gammaproteobacteria bacterium]
MSHRTRKFDIVAPRSEFYHGPFGRICPHLPAWSPPGVREKDIDAFFLEIANSLMIELPGKTPDEIASDNNLVQKLETTLASLSTTTSPFIRHRL